MSNHRGLAKSLGCLVLTAAVALVVGGCMSSEENPAASTIDSVAAAVSSTGVNADHKVVFPALYFELTGTARDPEGALREAGYADVEAGDDGSYTATVPGADYTPMVNDTYDLVKKLIDSVPGSSDYPHATAVDCDEQFATVTVTFDTADIAPQEALVSTYIGNAVLVYQQVAGLPIGCDVILVGPDGAVISETLFPQQQSSGTGSGASTGQAS